MQWKLDCSDLLSPICISFYVSLQCLMVNSLNSMTQVNQSWLSLSSLRADPFCPHSDRYHSLHLEQCHHLLILQTIVSQLTIINNPLSQSLWCRCLVVSTRIVQSFSLSVFYMHLNSTGLHCLCWPLLFIKSCFICCTWCSAITAACSSGEVSHAVCFILFVFRRKLRKRFRHHC